VVGQIQEWLANLGLAKYAKAFTENEIDFSVLRHLGEDDLKELGLPMGPRKKLLAVIAEFGVPESGPVTVDGPARAAERRQLTVMFVDLVGSTELAGRLDPEALREVILAYQETCAEAVGRFEGHIAKYIGDGLLVYFGYPQAHEDDARRAVSAGLGIVEGVGGLNQRLAEDPGVELGVRVGIHTGLVVAGEMGGGETREADAIVGETPNVAARIEGLAKPNTVTISTVTHALVEGLFECQDLGPQRLKGVSEAVGVYRVLSQSDAPSRFEAAVERGLTPLVGREEEIGLLLNRWVQAKDGEGQVVLLSGEAGVGKSRIVRAFRDRIEGERHSRVLYFGSPYHQNSAFYPVTGQLQRALRFSPNDGQVQKLNKLEAVLDELGLDVGDTAPTLAVLLSLPDETRDQAAKLSPQELKAKALEAIIAAITAMGSQAPVLMVVEDVHWVDPSTMELLDLVIDRLPLARLLLLITFRPDFQPPWGGRGNLTQLALNRLGRRAVSAMVENVTGGKALPREVLDQIITKTDGVPLYVEELTSTVLESGLLMETDGEYALTGSLSALAIPSSLQDSLMARLDRLASAKEVAQLAATIGRGFSHALLAAASSLGETEIADVLDKLVDSGLVYRRGLAPHADYEFKHALVRDAAYESLLKSTRQQHHRRIAEVLAEQFPAITETETEVLAHHFTEAEDFPRAAESWFEAGRQAQFQSATQEAIAHYLQAIELIGKLTDQDVYAVLELDCYLGLGALGMLQRRGPEGPKLSAYYARAAELSDKIGDDRTSYTVKWGKWYVEHLGGHAEAAAQTADELVELGLRQNDRGLLLQAHHSGWTSGLRREDLSSTLEHVENGLRLYVADEHKHQIETYGGHDAGVCCRMIGGMAYTIVGRLERGVQLAAQAVTTAQYVEHDFSEVLAHSFGATVHFLRRDEQMLTACVEEMEAKAGDQMASFSHFVITARMLKGWAHVKSGSIEPGLDLMESSLVALRESGFPHLDFQLLALADAKRAAGHDGQALETLAEAFEISATTGERLWLSELHRIKGEILLDGMDKANEAAERELLQALTIASKQGALLFELRAAKSLAKSWLDQDRRAAALDLLRPIYRRFTEGLDSPDLVEAKAILDELYL
jgi:class 3 adenylate cyclase